MKNKRQILAQWIRAYRKLGDKTTVEGLLSMAKYCVEYQRPIRFYRESKK